MLFLNRGLGVGNGRLMNGEIRRMKILFRRKFVFSGSLWLVRWASVLPFGSLMSSYSFHGRSMLSYPREDFSSESRHLHSMCWREGI